MKVKAIDEYQQFDVDMPGATGARMRMLIGPKDGAENFHMRHFEIAPGGHTPHHKHNYEHEILILSGQGIAVSEEGERPFAAGDAIFVPANEMHQFVNRSDQPCTFICSIPAPADCGV